MLSKLERSFESGIVREVASSGPWLTREESGIENDGDDLDKGWESECCSSFSIFVSDEDDFNCSDFSNISKGLKRYIELQHEHY